MALPGALPVLIWNAGRDWPTLSYHLMSRHTRPVGLSLANLGKLFGGQLAYLSPLVLVALGAVAATLWRRRSQDAEARLLLACAAPLLLSGYLLILLVPGAEPHWPAAGYLPLLVALGPLLPIWLKERRRARVLTTIGVVFSLLVALGFHVHILTDLGVRIMPASYVPRYDLSNELRGWPSVADAAADWLGSLPREQRTRVVVGGCHYTSCSQLAFAARGRFRVVCPSVRADQYDQSAGGDGADLRGVDLLYLYDERFPFSTERLYRCRGAPEKVREVEIIRASRVVRRFSLHLCRGFSGLAADRWPPP